jgi:hypothetical protein
MNYDDVLVIRDAHGDEESVRVLWQNTNKMLRVKSITKPHKKAFTIKPERVIRNEGQRYKQQQRI